MKTINQPTVNFLDVGAGPVVLLVHGFPLNHLMWRYQIKSLSMNHRVICPDLPGFGASPGSGQSLTLRQCVEGLIGLLDRLEIETVSFCGLSMGGYIGWQFWKQYPDRLTNLIACNTRAGADNETMARARRVSAGAARENGIGNLANEMIVKMFAPANLSNLAEAVELVREMISSTDPESVAQGQLAMAERPDATQWLAEIRVPTLFIAGQFDNITSTAEMQSNCELVPGAQICEIPQAGHLTPLENPQIFNEVVLAFLRSQRHDLISG